MKCHQTKRSNRVNHRSKLPLQKTFSCLTPPPTWISRVFDPPPPPPPTRISRIPSVVGVWIFPGTTQWVSLPSPPISTKRNPVQDILLVEDKNKNSMRQQFSQACGPDSDTVSEFVILYSGCLKSSCRCWMCTKRHAGWADRRNGGSCKFIRLQRISAELKLA